MSETATTGGLIRYTFNIKLCNNGETQCRNEPMKPFTTRVVALIKPNLGVMVHGCRNHALCANTVQTLLVTLAISGDTSGLKAVRGADTVDASGAVFTLREGQTQVSFALASDSPIDADQTGALSVSYQGSGGSGQSAQNATSNSWAITLQDAGEPANAEHPLQGDYLVKTETYRFDSPVRRIKNYGSLTVEGYALSLFNVFSSSGILDVTAEEVANTPSVTVLEKDQLFFVQDASGNLAKGTEDPTIRNVYNEDGEVTGTEEIPSDDKTVTDNTLFGSAAKDKIDGKTGNDLIDGGGGNDQIDGGSGNDMIGGGTGSDNIKGGEGDDYISSSGGIIKNRQQISATDLWANWGVPDGKTAIHQGAMWGTYLSEDTAEFKVTTWAGITNTSTDKTDTEGDVIDGGAGDDWVMGSWAGDRIKGGEGKDNLDGLAGDDILEGGAGDDSIQADGIIKAGYLNSVDAANNGNDFADGGEGKDQITGSGLNSEDFLSSPTIPKLGTVDVNLENLKKKETLGLAEYTFIATQIVAINFFDRNYPSATTRRAGVHGCKRRSFLQHSSPCPIAKQSTNFNGPIQHPEVAP